MAVLQQGVISVFVIFVAIRVEDIEDVSTQGMLRRWATPARHPEQLELV